MPRDMIATPRSTHRGLSSPQYGEETPQAAHIESTGEGSAASGSSEVGESLRPIEPSRQPVPQTGSTVDNGRFLLLRHTAGEGSEVCFSARDLLGDLAVELTLVADPENGGTYRVVSVELNPTLGLPDLYKSKITLRIKVEDRRRACLRSLKRK